MPGSHRLFAVSLTAALVLGSVPAPARGSDEPVAPLTPLTYDWTADGIVTGVVAATAVTLQLLKTDLAPLQCKWCVPGTIDGNVARSVAWSNPSAADTLSKVLVVTVPVGAIGYGLLQGYLHDDPGAGWSDALLITEAASIALVVDLAVKYAVGRARPYVWLGSGAGGTAAADANLSFFSADTTFTFAVAVAAGTIFFMQDLPGAPWVLGVGLGLAALTGYLRMAAEQHYLSDVLTGAAVGSLIGFAVPYFFHGPRKGSKALQAGDVTAAPGGIAVAW